MDVLSLISTKGGAGKTTVAANLGGMLADAGLAFCCWIWTANQRCPATTP